LSKLKNQERADMNMPSNDQISAGSASQPHPGDEAPPGTPGTGEDVCPVCKGSGKEAGGGECPNCGGTGKIVEGIGGG
jgi:hypothetical protein